MRLCPQQATGIQLAYSNGPMREEKVTGRKELYFEKFEDDHTQQRNGNIAPIENHSNQRRVKKKNEEGIENPEGTCFREGDRY